MSVVVVAYLPVEHPDILEFLQIRNDDGPIQNLSIGVTISDAWMKEMLAGTKTRESLGRYHQKRFESGYPYIFYKTQ